MVDEQVRDDAGDHVGGGGRAAGTAAVPITGTAVFVGAHVAARDFRWTGR